MVRNRSCVYPRLCRFCRHPEPDGSRWSQSVQFRVRRTSDDRAHRTCSTTYAKEWFKEYMANLEHRRV